MAWKSRCSMVNAVVRYSRSDAEVTATVVSMVNQGHVPVRHLQGSRFDLGAFSADGLHPRSPERLVPTAVLTAARHL
jgi:hypothetical protein